MSSGWIWRLRRREFGRGWRDDEGQGVFAVSEGKAFEQEIIGRHKEEIETGRDPEKEKRDAKAERDMERWEVGSDHR